MSYSQHFVLYSVLSASLRINASPIHSAFVPQPVLSAALIISACSIYSTISPFMSYQHRKEYLPALSKPLFPLSCPIRSVRNICTSYSQRLCSISCPICCARNIYMFFPQCYVPFLIRSTRNICVSSCPIHSACVLYPVHCDLKISQALKQKSMRILPITS